MKFLVLNYSCLQNPWLGGLPPHRSPFYVSSVLKWIFWTPPNKIPGYATADCYGLMNSYFLPDSVFGRDRSTALIGTFVVRCRLCSVRWHDSAARQMKEKVNTCELYRTSSNDHTEAQDMSVLVPMHHQRTFTPHVCIWRDASSLLAILVNLEIDKLFLFRCLLGWNFGKSYWIFFFWGGGDFGTVIFLNKKNSTLNMEKVYW